VKWKGWKARTGNGVTGGDGTSATDWEPERNLGEELFHVRRKGARKGSKPNGLITQFFLDRDGKEGRPFLDPTADLVNGVWDFKTHLDLFLNLLRLSGLADRLQYRST
jgi:hypothetical protein